MPELPRKSFPLEAPDLARIFVEAHPGPVPSRAALPFLAGIIGVENAGGKALVQHNWGNIMAGDLWRSSGRDYWPSPVSDPEQPAYFRAYDSHEQGARAWWSLMYGKRYRSVLEAALGRSATAVARELYRTGYVVGGSPSAYAAGIARYARQWQGLFPARIGGAGFVAAVFGVSVSGIAAVIRWG